MAYKNRACLFIATCENEAQIKENEQEVQARCFSFYWGKKGSFDLTVDSSDMINMTDTVIKTMRRNRCNNYEETRKEII